MKWGTMLVPRSASVRNTTNRFGYDLLSAKVGHNCFDFLFSLHVILIYSVMVAVGGVVHLLLFLHAAVCGSWLLFFGE